VRYREIRLSQRPGGTRKKITPWQVNDLIHNTGAVFIGIGSTAVDTGSAIGDFSAANAAATSAYGFSANASAPNAIAIGANSVASATNSTASVPWAELTGAGSPARRRRRCGLSAPSRR
jgi:hypothetical protein